MTPAPHPLKRSGTRKFWVSELQLYGLFEGWTHTALLDPKGIMPTIRDDQEITDTSASSDVLDILDEWLNGDDHLTLFKWEVREKIRELRQHNGEH